MKLPSLTSIGLSEQAELAYRQLTTSGPHQLADLSRILGFPARHMRRLIDELADVAAVSAVAGPTARPRKGARMWAAASADQVSADIRRRQQEAALAWHRLSRRLASPADFGLQLDGPKTRVICGMTSAQARLEELARVEQHEHLAMSPDMVFTREAVHAAAAAHRSLMERRIVVRDLSPPPAPEDATDGLVKKLAATGSQFRELPSLPARIIIFDRSTALVRLDPTDPRRGVLEITDGPTVGMLVQCFFRHWERAQDGGRSKPADLTSRERAVVSLLATGRGDAAVAAELGLSLRTIAHTVRGLMNRFGVTNRFQLGLVIAPIFDDRAIPTNHPQSTEVNDT